jgi:diketogulonate reductase-like aldo/keto reductase
MVQSGIPREEIFITTKVQAGAHTVEGCKRKVEKSLNDLGLGKSQASQVRARSSCDLVHGMEFLVVRKLIRMILGHIAYYHCYSDHPLHPLFPHSRSDH